MTHRQPRRATLLHRTPLRRRRPTRSSQWTSRRFRNRRWTPSRPRTRLRPARSVCRGPAVAENRGESTREPDESPFDAPEVMTGYPLSPDEQERVDRIVEEANKKKDEQKP